MKFFISLPLLLLTAFSGRFQNSISSLDTADGILNKVFQKLSSLKNIRYNGRRELNYPSEHYLFILNADVYCDFQSKDTIFGFKYQIEDSTSKEFFNGKEKFYLYKRDKSIVINDHPNVNKFGGPWDNSIITLKNALPLLINDTAAIKTFSDTIIGNKLYSLVSINLGQRWIPALGKTFNSFTQKRNWTYKIIVEKSSYLPVEVLQTSDLDNDFTRSSFTNIQPNTSQPPEQSWYSSSYTNEYKPPAEQPEPKLVSNGSMAPDWKLKTYNTGRKVSLSDFKGKVILLDFWFKNCGACILSEPYLIELKNKFKDRNFEIAGINFSSSDSKEDIRWFCNKQYRINYTVLLNGKAVAAKYGVNAGPTFLVIDKKGKIIYSQIGFDESSHLSEIERVIKKAL